MSKQIQLFLLPFAGGNANSFRNLIDELDENIEAIPVEYSGRGERHRDGFLANYTDFFDDVVLYINRHRNEKLPYAVLGYSLGSALAFDILSKDKVKGGSPVHAIFCARGNLKTENKSQDYYYLAEEEFVERIIELGGMDERILSNKRFLDIYLRPIRADYKIWSQYKYNEADRNLECDLTVFYSDKDITCVNPLGWTELTSGHVDFFEMGENHFFILDYYKEMADEINKVLLGKYEYND